MYLNVWTCQEFSVRRSSLRARIVFAWPLSGYAKKRAFLITGSASRSFDLVSSSEKIKPTDPSGLSSLPRAEILPG